jgi:hypothetical protein
MGLGVVFFLCYCAGADTELNSAQHIQEHKNSTWGGGGIFKTFKYKNRIFNLKYVIN